MKKLIDYILDRGRRLICPVGGGSVRAFRGRPDIAELSDEERMARWMAFQAEAYGHDFLFSTMLDVQVCKALGLKTFFLSDGGEHVVQHQVVRENDLRKLDVAHALNTPLVQAYIHCIKACKKLVDKPVGGACFGPFTTAGAILGTQDLCLCCLNAPDRLHNVLELATGFILEMARACENSGADFFWIAEPSAVLVSPDHFRRFSGRYLRTIFQGIGQPGFLHVPGNTSHLIDEFIQTGAQCLSLDHHVDMRDMAHLLPVDVSVLGNIDSLSMLFDPPSRIVEQVNRLSRSIKNFPNIIVGSGGGLSPETPEENINALFAAARTFPFHSREDFSRIDTLWRAMVDGSFDDILALLSTGNFTNAIVRDSFEEACCFSERSYLTGKCSSSDRTRQMEKLNNVLKTRFFNSDGTLLLEGKEFSVKYLRNHFTEYPRTIAHATKK